MQRYAAGVRTTTDLCRDGAPRSAATTVIWIWRWPEKLCTEYGAIVQEWTVDKLRY